MSVTEAIANPFKPKAARIVRHYDLIEDHRFFQIRHIDMKKAMSFTYNPGQFIMLSIPGVGEAPFSISSTPRIRSKKSWQANRVPLPKNRQ